MSLLKCDGLLCAEYNQHVVSLIKDFNRKVNSALRNLPDIDGENELGEKDIAKDSQNAHNVS